MNRRTTAIGILAAWGGALSWLLVRQVGGPDPLDRTDAVRAVEPGAMYYVVSLDGTPVGFASNTVDTVPGGLVLDERVLFDVPALGDLQRTETRTVAQLSNTLRLSSFEATLVGAAGRFIATGTVGDSTLEIVLTSDQSEQSIDVALSEPVILPPVIPLRVAFGGDLAVGNTYDLTTFDPILLQRRSIAVEVIADSVLFVPDSARFDSSAAQWVPARVDTVPAWRLRQEVDGIEVDTWVDQFGRIVSARSETGLAFERTAFELAFLNFRDRDRDAAARTDIGSLVRQTAIAAGVRPATERATFRVRLEGPALDGFDLDGRRQTRSGDTVVVERADLANLDPGYRLPSSNAALEQYLRPEPLIQSDDPRIGARSRQIVDRTRNPRRAAERLATWVYQEVDKRVTVGVPSAVEALATQAGDCNEHALLFTAMARAAGLPARTVAGLIYIDGRFFYHAWAEVYLGEWVAFDPTFGQTPADASHLRLVTGGLARQTELIHLIGPLTIDVLEAEE